MSFPIITIKNYIRLSPPPCHGHKIRFQQRGVNEKSKLIQGENIVMRKIDFGAIHASKVLEMVFPLSSNNRRSEPRLIHERQFPAKITHNDRKTGIKNARGGNWSFQITTGTDRKTRNPLSDYGDCRRFSRAKRGTRRMLNCRSHCSWKLFSTPIM